MTDDGQRRARPERARVRRPAAARGFSQRHPEHRNPFPDRRADPDGTVLACYGDAGTPDYLYVAGALRIRTADLAAADAVLDFDTVDAMAGTAYSAVTLTAGQGEVPEILEDLWLRGVDAMPHFVVTLANHSQWGPGNTHQAATGAVVAQRQQAPDVDRVVVVIDTGAMAVSQLAKAQTVYQQSLGKIDPSLRHADPEPAAIGGTKFAGHGTFVAGVVLANAPQASVTLFAPDMIVAGNGAVLITDDALSVAIGRSLIHAASGDAAPGLGVAEAFERAHGATHDLADGDGDYLPRVLNLSLAGPGHPSVADPLPRSSAMIRLYALDLGAAVVAAAGNDHRSDPHYPAAYPYVTGVGSLHDATTISAFSNHGSWVADWEYGEDVVAPHPGQLNGNGLGKWSGTSFAAPIVSAREVSNQ